MPEPVNWPSDARCAVLLTFDLDGESPWIHRDPALADRPLHMSMGAYGPKTGAPRLLELLDRYGIRTCFFIPGWIVERYPALCEEIVRRGHEVGHHGVSPREAVLPRPARAPGGGDRPGPRDPPRHEHRPRPGRGTGEAGPLVADRDPRAPALLFPATALACPEAFAYHRRYLLSGQVLEAMRRSGSRSSTPCRRS